MHDTTQKGSTLAQANHLHTLLNFCRTVLRSDEQLLQLAMREYEQSLFGQELEKAA